VTTRRSTSSQTVTFNVQAGDTLSFSTDYGHGIQVQSLS
jgi:hypothetical protein